MLRTPDHPCGIVGGEVRVTSLPEDPSSCQLHLAWAGLSIRAGCQLELDRVKTDPGTRTPKAE
jgi:hypothetical protein